MSGSSLSFCAALFLAVAGGSGAACAHAAGLAQQNGSEYVVIAVSVFREPGFALPGADVTLTPDASEATSKPKQKVKKLHGVTSPRGEYAFRVPLGPRYYILTAAAKNYRPEEKRVAIQGEERVDVTVTLAPSSK
jgi:hypothetical protein